MADAAAVIQSVSNGLYVLLAIVAIRLWLADRSSRGAMWVAATFVTGGLVVVLSLVLGGGSDVPLLVTKVLVALLIALPWCLHRFVQTMERRRDRTAQVLEAGMVGLLAVTLAVTRFPGPEEEPTAAWMLYTAAFLVVWTATNVRVARVLLRATRGQPNVIRRRLQVLAAGSLGLALALLLPAFAPEQELLAVAGGLAGALSGVLFLVGFQPPSLLRARWREPEELALHEATKQLMLATRREEVATTLLPCMTGLVGARASALVDAAGDVVARHGAASGDLELDGEDVLEVPVAGRQRVLLWISPWSPMFGEDERRLVARLSVLSDLALDRAERFEGEQRARAEAERANREVESFIATITHDLRNPLTTIGGMADLLLGPLSADLNDRAREFVERIRGNTGYMGALVDDILALAEVGATPARAEPVDLEEVANGVALEVGLRQPLAAIEVHSLPEIQGDPVRLRRLFENVIGNALKHGGREDIRMDVSAVRDGDWLEIRILDDGRGVPPAAAERVFGLFERLEGRGGGTGLGLAICRKLVEQQGGSMWFATSSAGADLRIRLPADVVLRWPDGDDGATSQDAVAASDAASLAPTRRDHRS